MDDPYAMDHSLPVINQPYHFLSAGSTCMYVGVLLHVGLLVESFTAVAARVRPGVRVYHAVRGQGGRTPEALSALIALVARSSATFIPPTRHDLCR